MPRLPLVVSMAIAVLLAACTPLQWVRPDASPQQVELDMAQCRQQAWREAQWRAFLYRPFGPTLYTDGRGRHFIIPNSPFGDPFGDAFMEESRLTHFCMRAKGYDLEPLEARQ